MNRARLVVSPLLAALLVAPNAGRAQETEDPPVQATEVSAVDQQISVDRETFNYPAGTRRDPFQPLSAGDELGPRFEDLNLSGVVYSPATGSIAILMDRATGKRYRVWEGDVIGGAKLVRVRAVEVDFVVTAFGVSRQETLRLKSLDKEQGG
jgi:hypothetical protein